MPWQIETEVEACIEFADAVMKNFGFDKFEVELSDWDPKHPENYPGKAEDWQHASDSLARTMARLKIPYKKMAGEDPVYGAKIDAEVNKAIGGPGQLAPGQLAFYFSARFLAP